MVTTFLTVSKYSTPMSSNQPHQDVLNDEDIVKVMKRKLGTKDFRIEHWSLDPTPGSDGFLGQYFNLRVTCSVKNNGPEIFVFFAKTKPPIDSPTFSIAHNCNVMNKEIKAYEELMPRMGAGNGTDWKADSFLGKKDLILVLEDVTLEGYTMPDKYVPFGFEECVVLMRSLAKFHSRSFILEEKLRQEQGKTIKDLYGDLLEEGLFPRDDATRGKIWNPVIQGCCDLVDLVEGLDDFSKQRVKNRIAKWGHHMSKLLEASDKYRNVICHRDVWANNFMLKRDGSGRPEGCYLVDFQFLSYLPPAADVMLSLHFNAGHKTRSEHFDALTKVYHECLSEALKTGGLDVENCVSWKEFRESCEKYRNLAVIYVILNQLVMLIDTETKEKYYGRSLESHDGIRSTIRPSSIEVVSLMFKTIKEYRERMTQNVFNVHQWLSDDVLW